jgi:RNA polymerase sigma-70 factor, ECF subfamily
MIIPNELLIYEKHPFMIRSRKPGHSQFEALLEHYRGYVLTLAKRTTDCSQEAEDIAQEVFLNIWRHWPRLQQEVKNIKGYITITTRHIGYRMLEKKRKALKGRLGLTKEDDWIGTLEAKFQYQQIRMKALQQLPVRQKQVWMMALEQGLNYREIANVLRISPSTAKQHRAKAFETLHGYLRKVA